MASKFNTSASRISVGHVYGKWTVLDVRSPSSLCRCTCGKEGLIRNSWMVAGRIKGGCHSCANKRERPGRRTIKSSLPKDLYAFLGARVRNAIARCVEPSHQHWEYYGGRGVKVCQEWLDEPEKFLEHLATLPGHADRGLVIDRIENDQSYKPGNVRFVTKSVSQQNKGPYGKRVLAKD